MEKIDLHIHTTFSDEMDSVAAIVSKVRQNNIKIFSITDHDCIKANFSIKKCDLSGLIYHNGIEFSCGLDNMDMHLLGYGFDINSPKIATLIARAKENRMKNLDRKVEHVKIVHNITLPQSEIDLLYQKANITGSVDVAKILIKMGYGDSIDKVIKKYLTAPKTQDLELPVAECIDAIGTGFSVLAHPKLIMKDRNLAYADIDNLVGKLKTLGLSGVEVYHSKHTKADEQAFLAIAKKHKLYVSGGSDYHGINKSNVEMGIDCTSDVAEFLVEMMQ